MRQGLNHIILVLLMASVIFIWSCSPKTLAIFFDGVPDPNDTVSVFEEQSIKKSGKSELKQIPSVEIAARYYFHSPYQQRECASCHDPNLMGKLLEPLPGLCYSCHDDFSSAYKVMHAPVEAGECLICHQPHMSENKHLLLKTGQQLCFECHDSESVFQAEYHAEIGTSDCIDCHNPHGGADRFILN
jgi:predicted CXXCH cytochrome family protein